VRIEGKGGNIKKRVGRLLTEDKGKGNRKAGPSNSGPSEKAKEGKGKKWIRIIKGRVQHGTGGCYKDCLGGGGNLGISVEKINPITRAFKRKPSITSLRR